MKRFINHSFRLLGMSIALLAGGCSSMPTAPPAEQPISATSQVAPSVESPGQSLRLTYRTESSRLNAEFGAKTIQTVSYQQSSFSPVPDYTTSTLDIRYPHPAGIPDFAAVTVAFESQTESLEQPTTTSKIWTTMTGGSAASAGKKSHAFREVWTIDLPRWQLEALLAKLRKENFFIRAKVMNANSFVATELDGVRFGKNYKPIDELDSLILRIRSEGRPANAVTIEGESTRLPPIQ